MQRNSKRIILMTKSKVKVPYLLVKCQFAVSVVFVAFYLFTYAPQHMLVSLIYGLTIVNMYIFTFHCALIRLINKKKIALAMLAIVFKWSILWLILREFLKNTNHDFVSLSIGLSSIFVTAIVYLISFKLFEEKV